MKRTITLRIDNIEAAESEEAAHAYFSSVSGKYFVVERSASFSAQEITSGINTYYFEYADQANSGYGGINKVVGNSEALNFQFNDQLSTELGFDRLKIDLRAAKVDWQTLRRILSRVLIDCENVDLE